MKISDQSSKLLTYLHTQPGSVASKQDIITAMARVGITSGQMLQTLLGYMVAHNQIVHSSVVITGTKVHRYTAV